MISLLLVILACLFFSAFFSGSEMAFVSSNQLKMREKADVGNPDAKKIMRLHEHSQEFLASLLIGNNVVNIVSTATATYLIETYFGIHNEWLVTALMVPLLLIGGEMVPKDYGRIRSEGFLLKFAGALTLIMSLFHWPVRLILKGVESMLGRFKSVLHKNIIVSQNEFRMLIEESAQSGVLNAHEKQLINIVLDFERIHVSSVMISLEKTAKVDIHTTVGELKALVRRNKVRMVLVYEEIPSIVMGMVYVYDILFESEESKPLKDYLRAPIFLPGSASIEKAFLTLQQKRQSFAVVMDEKLETVGIVPIERLIEF
ncbi:MAG: DUF21 domain-containing protein [Candidatus Omnitrophica bacterium]|nr:DUF21 domain-containing protein [Candidatus Omnitrophota bacterium]